MNTVQSIRALALVCVVALGCQTVAAQTAPAAPKPAVPRALAAKAVAAPAATEPGANLGYTVEAEPGWVVPAREPPTARVDAAPMHYRVIDSQIRVEGKSAWNYSHVVRVPNDAAGLATASQIELEFDPTYQSFVLHRLDVLRDGKRASRIDRKKIRLLQREAQLERQMYDGRVTVSIVLDDVRVGDQIDFAYSVRGSNPVFDGKFAHIEWMSSPRGPVALYQVRLLAPAERAIRVQAGSPDMREESRSVGALRETVFRREAVPQLRTDANAPYSVVVPHLLQFSEFADWAEVARWGQALFAQNAVGQTIEQKAAEIRAASADPAARVVAALQFVQKDVRYFGTEAGIGSHRPAAPDKVIEQRFGDCKDKVTLLIALLRRLDVAASPVLVSTLLRGRVAQQLPGPLAFDHVIARVELNGAVYWLDATRTQQSGELARRQSIGLGSGLVLADASTAMVSLPAPFDAERLTIIDTIRIARFIDAPTLESRITYRGELAEIFRDLVAQRGAKDVAVELNRDYLRIYPKIQSSAEMRIEDSLQDDAITFVQRFTVPEFWRFPEQRFLQADVVQWGVVSALIMPKSETRRDAFAIAYPGRYSHKVVLEYPEDVFAKPFSQRVDEGDNVVSLKVSLEGTPRRVEYLAEARLGVEQIEPQAWEAHVAKVGKMLARLGSVAGVPTIALSEGEAVTRELKSTEEAVRGGKAKVVTATQAQALFKAVTLTAQIKGGRLPPALEAQALNERGVQYDHLGRHAAARTDFELAMSLSKSTNEIENAAAVNAIELRDFDRAIELANAVLQRAPSDSQALNSRALARYFKGEFGVAKADFEELLKDRAAVRRGYPIVWLALATRRAGQSTAPLQGQFPADQLPTDWPRPLIELVLGNTSVDAVITSAKAAKLPLEPLCEAYFYIGEKYHVEGDTSQAGEYWRKSADLGVVEFVEHGAARFRLASVGAK